MILIAVAWLLVLAIALYQSMHGMFSALVMAVLTTICAVFALGTYEWMGPAFLYSSQPAFADAISLTLHFVIPLLVLRLVFDKLIADGAPLGARTDRAAAGLIGLYIGTVMVGVLVVVLQMLPWGPGVLGYKPYDNSLKRVERIYCDEFALGLFKSASGLATDRSFTGVHDDLLLELFCARNTSGLNGRVDADTEALAIMEVCKPDAVQWKLVIGNQKLSPYPGREEEKSDVLIVKTTVSKNTRSDREEDGWYRLPGTHFRLVTGAGKSIYPLGYLKAIGKKWTLVPAPVVDGKADLAGLHVLRQYKLEEYQEILWVYRMPRMETEILGFDSTADLDPDEAEQIKADREALYAPDYMVFRRTSRKKIPLSLPTLLPLTPQQIKEVQAAEAAEKKAEDAKKKLEDAKRKAAAARAKVLRT